VAETFDAMSTNSPHQKAKEVSYVLERMWSLTGVKFDKEILEALVRALDV
jgi:HD-GYP domain-containing protein (c-di-GMP phosphodiesterase class II)